MVFLRLLGLLCKDVGKDLVRHRGQHFLAVLTLASGLLLAGGGLLVVQGLDRWVTRMEGLGKITVFANEGGGLDQAEGMLRRDPRFVEVRRVSSQEATRRFMDTTRDAGLMLKSLGEPIPETLELSLRPDLLEACKLITAKEAERRVLILENPALRGESKVTRSLFETNMFSLFGRPLSAAQQTGTYRAILREAEALANDTRFGFTLVHLPIPHAPHAYNRKTGEFTLGNSPIAGYVDSLALLDRTVGEIRRNMENAGTWDSTTVLFTSDHPYREAMQLDGKSDPRIPYILKLAGQKEGVEYRRQFNAVLTADLMLGVLRGEIADPASATAWLDRNRERSLAK